MADARIEIEEAMTEPSLPAEAPVRVSKAPQWRVAMPWLIAVLVGGLAIWAFMRGPAPGPEAPVRYPLATPPLMIDFSESSVALSPDGTKLVYLAEHAGENQLYLHEMGEMEATPIAGTENGHLPFFSPDGQWVGFGDYFEGKLKKVSLLGGPPLHLCDVSGFIRGAHWGPDDTIFFTHRWTSGGGIWRISAAGGTPEFLIGPRAEKGEWAVGSPEVLPGGKEVLFVSTDGSGKTLRVEVHSLETGERKTLMEGGNPARYAPSGHLVYGESGSMLAAPFDLARLELTGAPVPVVNNVRMSATGVRSHFSLSHNGTLVYVPGDEQQPGDRTLVWVDRDGKAEPITDLQRAINGPKLSPKGDRIAMWLGGGNPQVWVYELKRGTLTPLTSEGQSFYPIWSPEGKRLVFPSMRSGGITVNLFWKPADGSGVAERLTVNEHPQQPYSWSPDGKLILFQQSLDPETGWDIWVLPIRDDGKPGSAEPFLNTTADELHPALSPDGRWLAYVSNASGREEIYVTPFPGPGRKLQISVDGGWEPAWASSGRELFYGDYLSIQPMRLRMMVVDIVTQPELHAGIPKVLFDGPYQLGEVVGRDYDVTADGQRFVMIKRPDESAPQQVNVILNWFEELKRLVPTN
jgi:serine/threonine-protein kinase